jgi:hypothetical protein
MMSACRHRRLIEIRYNGRAYPIDCQGHHMLPMPRSRRRALSVPRARQKKRRPPSPQCDEMTEQHCSLSPHVPIFPSFATQPAAIRGIEAAAPEFPGGELDIEFAAALGDISQQTVTCTALFDA